MLVDDSLNKTEHTKRKRIGFVTTAPISINAFLRPHVEALKAEHDILLACNGQADDLDGLVSDNVTFHPVPLERKISFLQDLSALFHLWRLFRKSRLDSVHSITPKAGLLSMLAARLAGVPNRFHTFTGQVWVTRKGWARQLLKFADRLIAWNATQVLGDSHSQRRFLIDQNIVDEQKIDVLAKGSMAGVNPERYQFNFQARQDLRRELGIATDAVVFIFLGRLTRDKGLMDLSIAFSRVAENNPDCHLLVVGPDEENIEAELLASINSVAERVHRMGFTSVPERVLSASDVICLPSYREGFGSVLIEAAAAQVPAIASKIYGITDAGEEGVTYLLHPQGSIKELADAMQLLANDAELRRQMGIAARERAIACFSEEQVTRAMVIFYRYLTA